MGADGIYRTNIRRLALLAMPTWLRRPLAWALLSAGVAPLGLLAGGLRQFRLEKRRELGYTGQVCRLRGLLNDVLDPALRRIRIEDGDGPGGGDTLWVRAEARPLTVARRGGRGTRLFRRGYAGAGGCDFWVAVPEALIDEPGTERRLRALVDSHRLAGKRYGVYYL